MAAFIVEGGKPLSGTIIPQGAKNEALQVISAVLLTNSEVRIKNVPDILDVRNLINLLAEIGVKVKEESKGNFCFKADHIDENYALSDEFCRKAAALRGSVMLVGPRLSRLGKAYFPKPGGDKIGRRRVDTHLLGLMNLGAEMEYDSSKKAYFLRTKENLKGTYMLLD